MSKQATAAAAKADPWAACPRVRATQVGFYGAYLRAVGKVFTLTSPADFSDRWMEKVDPATPDDFAHVVPRKRPGVLEGRHYQTQPDAPKPAAAAAKPNTPAPAAPADPSADDDDNREI